MLVLVVQYCIRVPFSYIDDKEKLGVGRKSRVIEVFSFFSSLFLKEKFYSDEKVRESA